MQSLSRPEEPDALPELPPLDEDDEHGDRPPEDLEDLGDLVADDAPDSGDEDQPVDDADLPLLDSGIALDASDATHDDTNELVLDIQDLLNIADESTDPAADEPGFGTLDPDPAGDIESEHEGGWLDDGSGEDEESLEDLVSDSLPELDDDPTTEEPRSDEDDLDLLEDEPRPAQSAHSWSRTAHVSTGEALSAVTVREGQVVAAAVDILWLRDNGEDAVRLAARGSRITDLVLAGPECDTAVFATGIGTLGRRRRASHTAEALEAWLQPAGIDGNATARLRLAVPPSSDGSEIWLTASDRLLVSHDVGTSWQRIETPGRVRDVVVLADRIFAIVGETHRLQLVSAPRDGARWTRCAPGSDGTGILIGDSPMLAADNGVVALWDAERGLAYSRDGNGFVRVPGCAGISAVAVGTLDGRPALWLAVLDEASESSLLIMVDVESGTATTIAELSAPDEAADDGPEEPRISELQWDAGARRLWGITRGGLYRWEPPH